MSKRIPTLGENVPTVRQPLRKLIGWLWIHIFRWKFAGEIPNLKRFIAIGAPHTSTWDVPLAISYMWALQIDMRWMGKHTLFRPPFGRFMRSMGGIPVNRSAPVGVIDQAVQALTEAENGFVMGLAPEGTRSKVSRWKTGFYRIALAADVPVFPISIDFDNKMVHFHPPFYPTGDMEGDIAELQKIILAKASGKHPHRV